MSAFKPHIGFPDNAIRKETRPIHLGDTGIMSRIVLGILPATLVDTHRTLAEKGFNIDRRGVEGVLRRVAVMGDDKMWRRI
jgi:hypothetical protein